MRAQGRVVMREVLGKREGRAEDEGGDEGESTHRVLELPTHTNQLLYQRADLLQVHRRRGNFC